MRKVNNEVPKQCQIIKVVVQWIFFLNQNVNIFLARAAVPDKRSPHQRYILETHESSRAENIPPFVNAEYMST